MEFGKLKLDKVKIKNFRRIEDVEFSVADEAINVICIIGVNGSGKSSVISLLLNSLLQMTEESSPDFTKTIGKESKLTRFFSTSEIKHGTKACALSFDWRYIDSTKTYTIIIKNPEVNDNELGEIKNQFNINEALNNWLYNKWNTPNAKINDWVSKSVVLYRPAGRYEKAKYEEKQDEFNEFGMGDNWIDTRVTPFSVVSGLKEVERLILDIILDFYITNDKTQLDKIFDFLKELNPEYAGISVPQWPYRRIGIGKIHALSLLSGGELDLLVTAASIVAQQIYLKRKLNVSNASGIVMIDEVDSHLHPEFQERAMPLLTKHFPEIQFIVTTHSPFVLRSLKRENSKIIRLPDGVELKEEFDAMSIESILNIAFEVNGKWSNKITENLNELDELLSNEPMDMVQIKQLYLELSKQSSDLNAACDRLLALKGNSQLIDFIKQNNA